MWVIILTFFLIFFVINNSFATEELTILYTGNIRGQINPVRH